MVGGGDPPEPGPEPPPPEPEFGGGVVVVVVGEDPPEPEPDPELPEPPLEPGVVVVGPLEPGAVLGAAVVDGTGPTGPRGCVVAVGALAELLLCDGAAIAVPEPAACELGVVVSGTMVGAVDACAAGGSVTSTPAKAPPIVNPSRRLSPAPTRTALRTTQRRGMSPSLCSHPATAPPRTAEAAPGLAPRPWSALRRNSCVVWLRRRC